MASEWMVKQLNGGVSSMKYLLLTMVLSSTLVGCASNSYPTNNIPPKTTYVPEEKPEKYPHPPEDLRSVVGHDGWYHSGGYYYPSQNYYNNYRSYYRYR